jgi:hypothetical protein
MSVRYKTHQIFTACQRICFMFCWFSDILKQPSGVGGIFYGVWFEAKPILKKEWAFIFSGFGISFGEKCRCDTGALYGSIIPYCEQVD